MGGRVHKGFSSGIKMVFLTEVLEQFQVSVLTAPPGLTQITLWPRKTDMSEDEYTLFFQFFNNWLM